MKDKKIKIMLFVTSIISLISITVLLYISNETHYIDRIKLKLGMINYIENNSDYYALKSWESSLQSLNEDVNVVFLGDSMIRKGNWQDYFSDIKICNIGYSGDIIHGLVNRVSMVEAVSPEKVFITCGINNMTKNRYEETISQGYEELLDKLINVNHYNVYIHSILPVRSPNDVDNKAIVEENKRLKNIADKYGAKYIDLYSSFVDENGELNEKYSLDGTHVNDEGYKVWENLIREYVYE